MNPNYALRKMAKWILFLYQIVALLEAFASHSPFW